MNPFLPFLGAGAVVGLLLSQFGRPLLVGAVRGGMKATEGIKSLASTVQETVPKKLAAVTGAVAAGTAVAVGVFVSEEKEEAAEKKAASEKKAAEKKAAEKKTAKKPVAKEKSQAKAPAKSTAAKKTSPAASTRAKKPTTRKPASRTKKAPPKSS